MFEIPKYRENKNHFLFKLMKQNRDYDPNFDQLYINSNLKKMIDILTNIEKYSKGLTKSDIERIKNCIGNEVSCGYIQTPIGDDGVFTVSVDNNIIKIHTERYDYNVFDKNEAMLMALEETVDMEQEEKVNEQFINCINAISVRFPLMIIESYKLQYEDSIIFPRFVFYKNKGIDIDFRGCKYSSQLVRINYEKSKYYISFGPSINSIELSYYDLKNKIINFEQFRVRDSDLTFARNIMNFIKNNI